MRIKIGQKLIDFIRCKKIFKKESINMEIMKDIYNKELCSLFDKFSTCETKINGKNRKYLAGVNADPGVTEMTLTLLSRFYPNFQERKNIRVLNVACGLKSQNDYIKELGFQVYGIDYDIKNDTQFVKFCDLNSQNEIPFEENFFDCVIAQEIIEHLENPWLFMRKIKRVLKLNGNLILTTPNIVSDKSKQYFFNSSVGFFCYFNEPNMWQHINPIPFWELVHIIKYNGFELKKITGNNEYYVEFKTKNNSQKEATIRFNDVLVVALAKINEEIKTYQPIPTYNYNWGEHV